MKMKTTTTMVMAMTRAAGLEGLEQWLGGWHAATHAAVAEWRADRKGRVGLGSKMDWRGQRQGSVAAAESPALVQPAQRHHPRNRHQSWR